MPDGAKRCVLASVWCSFMSFKHACHLVCSDIIIPSFSLLLLLFFLSYASECQIFVNSNSFRQVSRVPGSLQAVIHDVCSINASSTKWSMQVCWYRRVIIGAIVRNCSPVYIGCWFPVGCFNYMPRDEALPSFWILLKTLTAYNFVYGILLLVALLERNTMWIFLFGDDHFRRSMFICLGHFFSV